MFILNFALSALVAVSFAADTGKGWEKIEEDQGVQVFKKEIAGSPVVAFRGEGVIHAKVTQVAHVIMDTENSKDWIDRLEETRLIQKVSDHEYIRYSRFRTPIVMKDRELIINTKIHADPRLKTITFDMKSAPDSTLPPTRYVRGEIMESAFILKSIENDTKTFVIAEIHMDPKGTVPKWIVNLVQKEWPIKTLTSLRKQSEKEGTPERTQFNKLLFGESQSDQVLRAISQE